MKLAAIATVAALASGLVAAQETLAPVGRDEYRVLRERIQDQYATYRDRCSPVRGHSRDLCLAQAQAEYDVARAELRARYKPTEANLRRAREARADAGYRVAKRRCGDMQGQARELCRSEARTRWEAERDEIRGKQLARIDGAFARVQQP